MNPGLQVVVVGGGIAGLVTAYRLLHSTAAARLSVTLLEAAPRAGGKIATSCFDGFIVEHGADSFLATRPWALPLAHELGLADELQPARHWRHRAFVRRGRRLHPLPDGLSGLVPASAPAWLRARMIGWPGRLRAAAERWVPARHHPDDESIAAFARRRFGRQAWDWLMEPLLAGIHGGDGEALSLRATFPALLEAELRHGSVTRGLRARTRRANTAVSGSDGANTGVTTQPPALPSSPFLTPRGGMERWITALLRHLDDCTLRTSSPVVSIDRGVAGGPAWMVRVRATATALHTGPDGADATAGTGAGTQDGTVARPVLELAADAVVLAVPSSTAAGLVRDAAPALAEQLAAIPFASTTIVQAAYAASAVGVPLEGSGHVNPRAGGRPVAACTWTSSKFEHRAPPGAALLRAFLKGEATDVGDDDVIRLALDEFRDALGVTRDPLWLRVDRHPMSMPQYTPGHEERVALIAKSLLALPGLFVAGQSYRGVGIPDTIGSANAAADAVLALAGYSGAAAAGEAPVTGRAGNREVDGWNG